MTALLYEQDAYCRSFDATVLSCEPCKHGFAVTLSATAFFPEGGGQAADVGTLAGAAVSDVQIKNGEVIHTVDRALPVGETVRGDVDWSVRFPRMQNHTGEHMVSGLIHARFSYDNVGFHMSERTMTLDVNGTLTADDIVAVEAAANAAVWENHTITAYYPDPDTLDTLDYRSKLDLTTGVRLVEIEGVDLCACCAPHVHSTAEVGVIKLLDAAPYKGGTRIEMVCGRYAFEDYAVLHDNNRRIMRLLSAKRFETADVVARDHDALATAKSQLVTLSRKLALATLETVPCGEVLCGFTAGASFDDLRFCTEQLTFDNLALFADMGAGAFQYVLCATNGDVRDTVKALNARFDGKGGGKPSYAQGKLTATKEALLAFFKEGI